MFFVSKLQSSLCALCCLVTLSFIIASCDKNPLDPPTAATTALPPAPPFMTQTYLPPPTGSVDDALAQCQAIVKTGNEKMVNVAGWYAGVRSRYSGR